MSAAALAADAHGTDALVSDDRLGLSRSFHTLDALRGLAAGIVVLFHANFIYFVAKPPHGFLAVDLFFAMSGFIIAHRYDRDLASGLGATRFTALRLVRLYPLFALGSLVGVLPSVLTLALQGRSPQHLALLSALPEALLMLPSRAALPELRVLYPLNVASWSLAFELIANVAYAALFRRLTLPVLAAVAAAGFAGLCGCALFWGTLEVGYEWPHALGGFARIAFAFPLGVLLRRCTLRGLRLPRVPWYVPLVAAALLFCAPTPASPLWSLAGCTIAMPAILVAAISSEPPRRLFKLFALSGVYSYVLYSLHMPLVGLFLRAETRLRIDVDHPGIAGALLYTALLAVACAAAHLCFDKPVRRALRRLLSPAAGRGLRSGMLSPNP